MTILTPPVYLQRHCGLHWLRPRSREIPQELRALQWNPGSRTWTNSAMHDTAFGSIFISAEEWEWIAHIPYPDISK